MSIAINGYFLLQALLPEGFTFHQFAIAHGKNTLWKDA